MTEDTAKVMPEHIDSEFWLLNGRVDILERENRQL